MAKQKAISRVWDIIEKVGVGMLTTRFAGGLRARPLEPRPDRDEGVIYFVTDVRGAKDDEIESAPEVGFVVIDHKAKAYLSITGRADGDAATSAKAAAIWKKTDNVWWPDGPRRSERARAAACAGARRAVGRTVEFRRGGVRIRQGAHHRREAEPRRESQGDGEDEMTTR